MASRNSAPGLAEAAIAIGAPVFPCGADKSPLTLHGFKDASADPDTIRRMFANSAAVMIGMPTGELTGLVVVDVDVKDGAQGAAWLSANSHRMPQARTIRTASGGLHIYLIWPGQNIRNSASKIAPGIDVRGDGGYVIVPPSPGYAVADNAGPADVPDWLMPALLPAEPAPQPTRTYSPARQDGGSAYGLSALANECDSIRHAPDGTKHVTLNKAAYSIGGLVSAGELQEGAALSELSAALSDIRAYCRDFKAAEKTLRNSFRDGMGKPRDVPDREFPVEEVHPAAGFLARVNAEFSKAISKPIPVNSGLMDVTGVLKMLVDECNRTAIRPQPFLALGAAICAVGALAGRRYRTPTDLRSNIYVAAIAESGGGKDHAPEIVRRAFGEANLLHYLGGETIASGRAVLSALASHPVRLFQVDELGLFLSGVTGKKAPTHRAEIWSELMKLYSRAKGLYGGTDYANQKENARQDIHSPHACFYGTTTPGTFWSALEGGAMMDGSLARFLVFITDDDRPERNRRPDLFRAAPELLEAMHAIAKGPPDQAAGNLNPIMAASIAMVPYTVQFLPDADDLNERKLDQLEPWALSVVGTPKAAIVNRIGENAAKLALIRAVSADPVNPKISVSDVAWGWAVSEHCARSLLQDADRFMADNEVESRDKKVLHVIKQAGKITLDALARKTRSINRRDRMEVIISLKEMGLIHEIKQENPGTRHTTFFAPTPLAFSQNSELNTQENDL